jgi:hypothetical protein
LRILVEHLQVGVSRSGVEVVVEFLDVFAVVALGVGEAEEAFFKDGIFFVPEGEGEAEALLAIAEAGEAIFAPAVGAAAGVVVGEVFPGVAVWGVVFADGAPLAFGEVRTPAAPFGFGGVGFGEAGCFAHRLAQASFGLRRLSATPGFRWLWGDTEEFLGEEVEG